MDIIQEDSHPNNEKDYFALGCGFKPQKSQNIGMPPVMVVATSKVSNKMKGQQLGRKEIFTQGHSINEASDERAEMQNNQATTIYHYEAIRSQEIERK